MTAQAGPQPCLHAAALSGTLTSAAGSRGKFHVSVVLRTVADLSPFNCNTHYPQLWCAHCRHSIKPDWLLSLIHLWGITCILPYAATKAIKKYGSDSHQVNRSRFLSSICPWCEARPDTWVIPAGYSIWFPSQPLWSIFISTVIFSVILRCCWFPCPIYSCVTGTQIKEKFH